MPTSNNPLQSRTLNQKIFKTAFESFQQKSSLSPHTRSNKPRLSDKENVAVVPQLVNQLDVMETEINSLLPISNISFSKLFKANYAAVHKDEFFEILETSKAFKDDKEKAGYLLKELEVIACV